MSKNDDKILQLKEQIDIKKKLLSKSKKFVALTNCSINFEGVQININTLQKDGLVQLLVKLNSLKNSAIELGLLDDYNISGYNISEWVEDLKNKLDVLSVKQEEFKLKQMEERLSQLLSEDKKVELELEDIINSLK
jgi:hypothetical protein